MHILSSILLAFSSSIDSLIIGIAYGVKQIRIKFIINLVISIIVTLTTFLAMCLGRLICDYIPADICNYIGSTLLIIVGLYMIWDYYKKEHKHTEENSVEFINSLDYDQIIEFNKTADIDGSGNIEISEAIILALSLSINNLALGIGASISGISIILTFSFNINFEKFYLCFPKIISIIFLTFVFSVITMIIGLKLGSRYLSKIFGEYSPLISAVIIIAMGIFEFFF